jgi:hypothetical protein
MQHERRPKDDASASKKCEEWRGLHQLKFASSAHALAQLPSR